MVPLLEQTFKYLDSAQAVEMLKEFNSTDLKQIRLTWDGQYIKAKKSTHFFSH